MRNFHIVMIAILAVINAGCQSVINDAPPAQTPSGETVAAILSKGGSWTTVGPSNPHEYKILPGGLPSGGFQLKFYAPWPALLEVTLDGVKLPKFEDIPSGAVPAQTGFYSIGNINPNPRPQYWSISIRPPANQLTSKRYVVGVANISINPKFRDAAGNNQKSAPMNLTMIAQDVSTMAILFPGAGQGTVSIHATGDANSTPLDTFCQAECSIDFGTLYDVTLNVHPFGSSTFSGWSGDCSGSGASCFIHLDGKAKAVAATFNRGSGSSTPAQNCPPLTPPAGFSYYNKPLCDSQNAYNDPTPDLVCDTGGYFCCAKVNGVNDPKCGNDHKSFPASCIGYNNTKVKLEPSGCYIQN